METTNILLIALVVAAIGGVIIAYKMGQWSAVKDYTQKIEDDTALLDRSEAAIHAKFSQSQIEFFRSVTFPIFALGLTITHEGDLKEAIKNFQDIVDKVTDGKPNIPLVAMDFTRKPGPDLG
jgi:hypothetical protein